MRLAVDDNEAVKRCSVLAGHYILTYIIGKGIGTVKLSVDRDLYHVALLTENKQIDHCNCRDKKYRGNEDNIVSAVGFTGAL